MTCMTQTLTIRLPQGLARRVKSKARASNTNVSAVARRLLAEYARGHKSQAGANALQQHIDSYAGSWDGHCSGEDLLRRTRG
jgi:predicted transcriptional regulator